MGPPGYVTPASMRASLKREDMTDRSIHAQTGTGVLDRGMRGELSFWEYDEAGFIIGGSPERVRQRLRDLVTELRVGQLITCMHMGNLSEEMGAKNNHLVGTEVLPYLRDIWADEPDHWTPKVSQERVAAVAPQIPLEAV
jgi:alkanesulfonate monooxygenase SsuD/methylene tetrahydromethanopterin reductase-like flavin-dependent oxidoreductase (luciferase family)